jgi:hypothetical protein
MSTVQRLGITLIALLFGAILLILSSGARAQVKVPEHLKGGKVTVKTKRGSSSGRSEDWAVVKRKNLHKYKSCQAACSSSCLQQLCVAQKPKTRLVRTITKTKSIVKQNTVTFHAGVGKNGVTLKEKKDSVLIEPKTVPILGISYSRYLGNGFSAGASVYTNETFTGNVGYSW